MENKTTGTCWYCGRNFKIGKHGFLSTHGYSLIGGCSISNCCPGSGTLPADHANVLHSIQAVINSNQRLYEFKQTQSGPGSWQNLANFIQDLKSRLQQIEARLVKKSEAI